MENLIVFLKSGEIIRYPENSEAEWNYVHGVVKVKTPLSDMKDFYRMEEIQSMRYSGNACKVEPAKKETAKKENEEREPCLSFEIWRKGVKKETTLCENGIIMLHVERREGDDTLIFTDVKTDTEIEAVPVHEIEEIYADVGDRKKDKA